MINRRTFRSALQRWYAVHGRDLPWRRSRDPYAILVSEFMLQQTQVATVLPYYRRWLERFPDFGALARARESDVLHAWQGLGYYARARNLHAAGKFVMENCGGQTSRSHRRHRATAGRWSLYGRRTCQFCLRSTGADCRGQHRTGACSPDELARSRSIPLRAGPICGARPKVFFPRRARASTTPL